MENSRGEQKKSKDDTALVGKHSLWRWVKHARASFAEGPCKKPLLALQLPVSCFQLAGDAWLYDSFQLARAESHRLVYPMLTGGFGAWVGVPGDAPGSLLWAPTSCRPLTWPWPFFCWTLSSESLHQEMSRKQIWDDEDPLLWFCLDHLILLAKCSELCSHKLKPVSSAVKLFR